MYESSDTIIAPATAVGMGTITILRLSGSDSLKLLRQFFVPKSSKSSLSSHMLVYGKILDTSAELVDYVMAVYMQKPHSFTCEDVVEIHCHSNRYIVKKIIDLMINAGARQAEPGEFSFRAFINGRIDLSEAEAIAELIGSSSSFSTKIALRHLEGNIFQLALQLKEQLVDSLALIEAYLDFPEDEVDYIHIDMLNTNIAAVSNTLDAVLSTFHSGKVLRDGISILILGEPNVGKSSLLNCLLGSERAIVTNIPGTTRDFIEEHLFIGHLPVKLVDTAGLRHTDDVIEKTGVLRAKNKIKDADLILFVLDGSDYKESMQIFNSMDFLDVPCVLVFNKSDLFDIDSVDCDYPHICVSAKHKTSIDKLENLIVSFFDTGVDVESIVITEQRHYDLFCSVQQEITSFGEGLKDNIPGEFLACHLREALGCLGRITGETVPEDILNQIFSNFCVGK